MKKRTINGGMVELTEEEKKRREEEMQKGEAKKEIEFRQNVLKPLQRELKIRREAFVTLQAEKEDEEEIENCKQEISEILDEIKVINEKDIDERRNMGMGRPYRCNICGRRVEEDKCQRCGTPKS